MTRRKRVGPGAVLVLSFVPAFLALAGGGGVGGRTAIPKTPRVIVLGWDGADWSLLDRLLGEGRLSNLGALVKAGRSWRLSTYPPMSSPLIWTTIATGRNPVDHGVGDFQELDPGGGRRLPISGRSRKVPAIWNVASAKGIGVGVVGWWATWPAEKVDGFLVSDRAAPLLFDASGLAGEGALAWPEGLAEGVAIVAEREGAPPFEDVAKGLRITRAAFDASVAAGRGLADPVTGYRRILASTRIHARIALDLYEKHRPGLLMVYFQGTDEIGHVAGRFTAPRMHGVSEEDFRRFSGAVDAIYVEHDRILGRFREKAARDGATLVVLSDHGFKWGAKRPDAAPGVAWDTAFLWHDDPGMLAAEGPAVVPSRERGLGSVFDVTPILCRILGLPADPAFEGRVLGGFGGAGVPGAAKPVPWEQVAKVERLVPRQATGATQRAADEFTKQLVALGYLTGPGATAVDARPPERRGTETAAHFQNLATFLRGRGRSLEALPYYRKALEIDPASAGVWMNYSLALLEVGSGEDADEALLRALKAGLPEGEAAAFGRAASYVERIEKRRSTRADLVRYFRSLHGAFPANDRYLAALGAALLEDGQCAEASQILAAIVARKPGDTESLNLLGLAANCLGRNDEAREWFQRSLRANPQQPAVRDALSKLAGPTGSRR